MNIPNDVISMISGLPGEEFIVSGLNDLASGRNTTWEASLILIARSRLTQAGLSFLATLEPTTEEAERQLYRALLQKNPESAYSNYVSLKRRLNSFVRCLETRESTSD